MSKILVPSKCAHSWQELLKDPDKHWKEGYSARTLAYCWEDQDGFPKSVKNGLTSARLDLEMLLAIPEFKVNLNSGGRASQNDLFVLSKDKKDKDLVVIMIEGKVSESFDKLIKEWKRDDKDKSKNSPTRIERFDFLASKLEIGKNIFDYDNLRYQLFHRTVSAILTAELFLAKKAIMLVHSFSQKNEWFKDYENFLNVLNSQIKPEINKIYKCKTLTSDIDLYLGWIKGEDKYLTM